MLVRKAQGQDIGALWDMANAMRLVKERDYFERNLQQQALGEREIFIALSNGAKVGWCILNWQPKYGFYKAHGIPETQDLNVLPTFRKRGIGAAMIKHCEDLARAKGCKEIGISVGLDASYGPAQRLYVKLGYIPDGLGVTYDRRTVTRGEFKPVDDNLCLMMVKEL